jgi:hypothetical protein
MTMYPLSCTLAFLAVYQKEAIMWIKAENGRLVNLAHAQVVELSKVREGEFSVIARFLGTGLKEAYGQSAMSDPLVMEIAAPKPQAEATEVFERIAHSIGMKETYIDLTRANV